MDRDFEGAIWAEHHERVSEGFTRAFRKLAYVFHRLNAIEYDAPWRHMRP